MLLSFNTSEGKEFLKELTKSQLKWAEVICKNYNSELQQLDITVRNSQPLLQDGPVINISKQERMEIIQDMVQLLEIYQPKFKDNLASLKSRYDEFYEVLVNGNEIALLQWAEKCSISPTLIGHMLDWSLRPENMALGRIIQPLLHGEVNWESQCCPICGEQADIALLMKENGQRQLGCSSCQVTWKYPRLKCISCDNANPETLKYYFVEEAPEQQIHYCQSCNNYLKTFDYRFTNEKFEDLLLLNYMTVHLDVLAEEKGLGIINLN